MMARRKPLFSLKRTSKASRLKTHEPQKNTAQPSSADSQRSVNPQRHQDNGQQYRRLTAKKSGINKLDIILSRVFKNRMTKRGISATPATSKEPYQKPGVKGEPEVKAEEEAIVEHRVQEESESPKPQEFQPQNGREPTTWILDHISHDTRTTPMPETHP